MLGIDSLDEVIKEIKSDKRHKGALIEKLSLDLVDETGKNKIEKYRSEIENLERKKEKTNLLTKKIKEKIQVFNKELKTLEKDYIGRKSEYEKINLLKEKFEEKKTLFESKRKLREEIKNLQDKIEGREKTVEKQRKKLLEFENLEQEIKNVEGRLNKTDETTYKIVKKIEQKKTFIESIKKSIKRIESKRKKIEKMGPDANCPTCERILGDQYNKLLKKFDKEKLGEDKEIESFLKDIKTEQENYGKASREKQALEKKRKYLQSQLREKERMDITIRNVLVEVERERTEIEEKEKRLKKIGEVKFELNEYDVVKKQVKEFYSRYQSSLDLLSGKKDKFGDVKLELEKIEGEKKLVIQEIKNLHEKITGLREFEKRIKEEKISVQYLKMLTDVMSSFRLHLISRIRPALSSYASDFFGRLTDGKYQEIELDDNYDIMVYDGGNLYDIARFSGGEEDLANLCLRLAISEIITERAGGLFNFIILDEIFGSQDMVRRQNIMKALNSLSSKFRQIFLITHIEDIKNYMENVILVSETEDGISMVKIE
jgi:exonuclease SbcC